MGRVKYTLRQAHMNVNPPKLEVTGVRVKEKMRTKKRSHLYANQAPLCDIQGRKGNKGSRVTFNTQLTIARRGET